MSERTLAPGATDTNENIRTTRQQRLQELEVKWSGLGRKKKERNQGTPDSHTPF